MKFPTPIQMLEAKRSGSVITIKIPDGRDVLIREYVRSWKKLLTATDRSIQVENWQWFPCSIREILSDISFGIHDRINRHLPWFKHLSKKLDEDAILYNKKQLVRRGLMRCECRWCGQSLGEYRHHNLRFCDPSCRRPYYP